MSDPTSPNSETSAPQGSTTPPGSRSAPNWRDLRREERAARRAGRHAWRRRVGWHAGPPVGAIVLMAIGVVVLLGNFGLHVAGHWWAALILVPAVSLLVAAIRFYRADNQLSGRVIGPAIGGFVLLAVALSLFFGFHGAGIFWPVILIALGGAIIARRNWWMRHQPPSA